MIPAKNEPFFLKNCCSGTFFLTFFPLARDQKRHFGVFFKKNGKNERFRLL